MKHTEGKWWFSDIPRKYGYIAVNANGPKNIARLHHTDSCGELCFEQQRINAHLIAAAPDLLEGLRAMLVIAGMYPDVYRAHRKEIDSYIELLDKAEGREK